MRRFTLILATAALALALPATALADTQTNTVPQTLTVAATTTLTGVPASIAYGTALAGSTATSPSLSSLSVTTNNANGVALSFAFTNLTAGTAGTIAATANQVALTGRPSASNCPSVNVFGGTANLTQSYPGPANSDWVVCSRTDPGTLGPTGGSNWTAKIVIPASAIGGSYNGTLTVKATES